MISFIEAIILELIPTINDPKKQASIIFTYWEGALLMSKTENNLKPFSDLISLFFNE